MYLRPAAVLLSLVYKCSIVVAGDKARQQLADADSTGESPYWWKNSKLLTKLQQDADIHRSIIAQRASNLRRRAKKQAAASVPDEGKECDPTASSERTPSNEEPDVGILTSVSDGCTDNYDCVPHEESKLGGLCIHKREGAPDMPQSEREMLTAGFCTCMDEGFTLERSDCFSTVVNGCRGEIAPDCVNEDNGPYVGAYCDYYVCLHNAYKSFEASKESNTKQCWCKGYYGSICHMCKSGFVEANDDFCEEVDRACSLSGCCETKDAATCFSENVAPTEAPEPTEEPTQSLSPSVSPLPTVPPVPVTTPVTEDGCGPVLPQCIIITNSNVCATKSNCRWRPNKNNKCVGLCQGRNKGQCDKHPRCEWKDGCCSRS